MAILVWDRGTLPILLLVLLIVLALANLGASLENMVLGPDVFPPPEGGSGGAGGGSGQLPTLINAEVFVIGIMAFLAVISVLGFLYAQRSGRMKELMPQILGPLLALAFMLAFIFMWRAVAGTTLFSPTNGGEGGPILPYEPQTPAAPFLGATLALLLIGLAFLLPLIGFALARRLRPREEPGTTEASRGRAVRHIEEAIYRLELGEEVRLAILRCYSAMTHLFQEQGLRDRESLTARELERLATRDLGLSSDASVRLRELFEEARYSSHVLTEEYKETALGWLRAVREELAAPGSTLQ